MLSAISLASTPRSRSLRMRALSSLSLPGCGILDAAFVPQLETLKLYHRFDFPHMRRSKILESNILQRGRYRREHYPLDCGDGPRHFNRRSTSSSSKHGRAMGVQALSSRDREPFKEFTKVAYLFSIPPKLNGASMGITTQALGPTRLRAPRTRAGSVQRASREAV